MFYLQQYNHGYTLGIYVLFTTIYYIVVNRTYMPYMFYLQQCNHGYTLGIYVLFTTIYYIVVNRTYMPSVYP